jgi:hypothetical protein
MEMRNVVRLPLWCLALTGNGCIVMKNHLLQYRSIDTNTTSMLRLPYDTLIDAQSC